jgi:YegS/Rv2252/BmrU family lipid kinase
MAAGAHRTLFVVNPHSANGRTRARWPAVAEALRRQWGHTPETRFTGGLGDATEVTRQALREGYTRIVAVGGDGTNNEIVAGFFEADAAAPGAPDDAPLVPINPEAVFAFIPSGTGGDLRRTLATPDVLAPEAVARHLSGTASRPIDVGRIVHTLWRGHGTVTRTFINIASFGLSGQTSRMVNHTSKALGGKASFLLIAGWNLATWSPRRVRLVIEGADGTYTDEPDVTVVAMCNGRSFGGGMRVAPDARIDDGHLDVVVGRGTTRFEALRYAGDLYEGRHLTRPWWSCTRARRVRAEAVDGRGEPVILDVDGETPGVLPATFDVVPGALRYHDATP